ncbi:MAG: hypothetical protein C4326_07825 [Ignavibacteria bacterium]
MEGSNNLPKMTPAIVRLADRALISINHIERRLFSDRLVHSAMFVSSVVYILGEREGMQQERNPSVKS